MIAVGDVRVCRMYMATGAMSDIEIESGYLGTHKVFQMPYIDVNPDSVEFLAQLLDKYGNELTQEQLVEILSNMGWTAKLSSWDGK